MKRRSFLKTTALGSMALGMAPMISAKNTHILSLSFDDGFKKSFYKIAEVHEEYGLKACLNVIASGHMSSFKGVDQWVRPELMGNFDDWNTLKGRGHEVMPHTWKHLNLTRISLRKAKRLMTKCFDYFEENLEGYKAAEAVYNFAFNASNPELDAFALERVRAVRTGGWLVLNESSANAIPTTNHPITLGCWGKGPDNCDDYVENEIQKFLDSPGGWLILNLHGLDNEGWGPVSTKYLDNLLSRMIKIDYLDVLPTGEVFKQVIG